MSNPLDLIGAWREAVQKLEQDLNANLTGVAGDERFSQVMNGTLKVYARLQAAQAEQMEKALARASLPSRADFRALHDRLDTIERQIGALANAVDRLARASDPAGARGALTGPQPARTRKPPGEAAPNGVAAAAPAPAPTKPRSRKARVRPGAAPS
jgi:polyhydroxyalkanoate synthesis regulator phasin